MANAPISRPWLIFAIMAPIYLLSMFQRVAPSILASDIALDFGVNVSELAIMSSVTFIAYGLLQLPSGLITDGIGARKTIFIFTLLASIGAITFALAPTLTISIYTRALLGVGCAISIPCMTMLALSFPENSFARVNGLFLACGILGTALAGAPLGYAAGVFGWRLVIMILGFIALALGITFFLSVRDAMPAKNLPPLKERLQNLFSGLKQVIRTKSFWPLCLWFSLIAGLLFAYGGLWWAPYLISGCGLSSAQAGSIISFGFLINLPGLPLIAIISDKIRSRKIALVFCGLMAFASMLVLPFFGAKMGYGLLMLDGLAFGIGCGWPAAIVFTACKETFPLKMAGTALGVINSLPYIIMTPLLQKSFGWILEKSLASNGNDRIAAYADAMWVNAIAMGLAFIIGFFIKETFPEKTK